MEDNSYLNLSLQKYNELYDKAKKFDELTKQFGDKLSETINIIIDNVNDMFTTDDEEQEVKQPKDYNHKTVHIGDKVLIKHDLDKIDDFECGYMSDMKKYEGEIVTVNYTCDEWFEFEEDEYHYSYDYRSIEKIISRNKEEK